LPPDLQNVGEDGRGATPLDYIRAQVPPVPSGNARNAKTLETGDILLSGGLIKSLF
jgi:hypothetical protein